jgi:GMP synthase-like glutamine amidotransferase
VTDLLFVRFDDDDTFGVAPSAVEAAGGTIQVWNPSDPSAERPSLHETNGLVVFGSVDNVEHADEKPFIKEAAELMREAVDRRVPVLGVCFGGQLLAWALDARVEKGPVRELGFEPIHPTSGAAGDPLFSDLGDGDRAFQWHMDTFDLPARAELLATGDRVTNQAFRVGDRAWGTQFHFEVDRAEIELWLEGFASHGGDLETEWGKSPDRVRQETDRFIDAHVRRGRAIFERFTRVAASAG